MKYESPELTALTPAINAIQASTSKGMPPLIEDAVFPHPVNESGGSGYVDWED